MEKCSPKGRDYFETKSSQTFNCSATCEGVYADVLWEEDTIMKEEEVMREMERLDEELSVEYKMYTKLERKISLMKGNKKNLAEEMDKEKFKGLISKYNKFKRDHVRHFRFHQNAPSEWYLPVFGKSLFFISVCNEHTKSVPNNYLSFQESNWPSPPSSWCRSTSTRPPTTRSRGTRRSRLRPS